MHEEKNKLEGEDLTHGSIGKEMWSLAWPMMLSFFFYTLYNLVDAYWVGKISEEAIAAVSISQITLFVMVSLGFGITVGSAVLMAMNIGAKNINEAERILGQSFVLSAILGAIFTAVAMLWRTQILSYSGAGGNIFEPALAYYTIISGGSILLFLMMAVMFAFNSQGDTHTLTKFFAISTLVNSILDPIMIFGWLGFPALGIAGAAWATLVSQAIFLTLAIRSLGSPHRRVRFFFKNLSLKWQSVKRVLDIGFPAALTQVIFPLGIVSLTSIVFNNFSEIGASAFSIGSRLEFFAYLPAAGFGFAGMAIMGQSLGARNLKRASEAFNKALLYSFLGAAGIGIISAIFSPLIIGSFTDDSEVIALTRTYLWTVPFSYGFLAILMVEASAFQAIGRSWPGFWIFVFRVGIITLPLVILLTKIFDSIMGVWVGVILGNIIPAILGYFWSKKAVKNVDLDKIPHHASR